MRDDIRQRIDEIMGEIQCPKGFPCAAGGFDNLCQARDFGIDEYLECLEDRPEKCRFALSFGRTYFCQCPLRVYLAKQLGK